MIAELQEMGVGQIHLMINGYSPDGASYAAPVDGSFNSRIATAEEWKAFVEQCHNAGIEVSFYTDVARGYEGLDTFNVRKDVASNFNELQLRAYENGVYYLLAPKVVSQKLANVAQAMEKTGADGVVLDVVGNNLYSTWNKNHTNTRTETMEIFAGLAAENMKTGFYTASAYLWQNADAIYEIPSSHSGYMVFSDTVPFMQMVLKGYVDYYNSYSNFNADRHKHLLEMIECGSYPSWIVTGRNSLELLNTPSGWLYTSEYNVWKAEMASEYQYVAEALNQVMGARIVRHERMDTDVVQIIYDNGMSIIINYTDTGFARGNLYVAPMDYIVVEHTEGR